MFGNHWSLTASVGALNANANSNINSVFCHLYWSNVFIFLDQSGQLQLDHSLVHCVWWSAQTETIVLYYILLYNFTFI